MKISDDGSILDVKSLPHFYFNEMNGSKSATVRFPSEFEAEHLLNCMRSLKMIRFTLAGDDTKWFVRTITNISVLLVEGKRCFLISYLEKFKEER